MILCRWCQVNDDAYSLERGTAATIYKTQCDCTAPKPSGITCRGLNDKGCGRDICAGCSYPIQDEEE